ncbi:hypothetical protein [Algoriphagus boritolerans]|uniref:Uncharacterized protein n=1 Tax=Algoriphagus boritolerans DSM 17298 = JCM 18970 TaxID=1120964 RepID=A0A1H5T3A9_9BACT|nr:hypothetical protein [Algoriphagus boritolerans]SEF57382.1 hypothetical protein SAMN03080598_00671 [Algoriphagus boritolerans DSM 17298 = JCM 18970]
MSVTIPTTPKGVEPISGFKIVPAYGIFLPTANGRIGLKPGNVLPDFYPSAKAGGNSWVRIQSFELEWCLRPVFFLSTANGRIGLKPGNVLPDFYPSR